MIFFCFRDPAATEIYTLSLHDALPIFFPVLGSMITWLFDVPSPGLPKSDEPFRLGSPFRSRSQMVSEDRKSTRLNSSHVRISYAVFCLKKKNRGRPDSNDSDTQYAGRR